MESCPREAIQVTCMPKIKGEKAKKPTVNINEEKCHYCGICEAVCPFGAMKIEINGKQVSPVIETESFPQFVRKIKVDEEKCGLGCLEIEEACPLDCIKIRVFTKDKKDAIDSSDKENLKVKIEINEKACPCCRICETKFPKDAINIEKMFYGSLRIDNEKCPDGCQDCIDVCPIPGVLYLSDEEKVQVNDFHCVYCGTCKIVCPEEDALSLKRTRIRHTEVRSGTWNKTLEKLASTYAVIKENESKNAKKLQKVIMKRLPPEVQDYNV